MKTIIYLITNAKNEKMYVGLTRQSLQRRWCGHLRAARKGARTALAAAIRKYGEVDFVMEHIASCSSRHLAGLVEADLIRQYGTKAPSGYNLTDGGDGVGGLSREIIERTAERNRGRKHTEKARNAIGLASRQRVRTDETKIKMAISAKKRGVLRSTIEASIRARLGKKLPPRSSDHSRKISDGLRRAWGKRRIAHECIL